MPSTIRSTRTARAALTMACLLAACLIPPAPASANPAQPAAPDAADRPDQPTIISAARFGGPGPDRIEGLAIAPNGEIYIAGSVAQPFTAQQLGVQPTTFNPNSAPAAPSADAGPQSPYIHAFVARLSPDGRRVLALWQMPQGAAMLTSVAFSNRGVYVAGYAAPDMQPTVRKLRGLITQPTTWQYPVKPYVHRDHWTDDRFRKTHDGRGTPIVLLLDHQLTTLRAATFLEGWQSVWHVPRPLDEDRWQQVGLAVAANGDVIVCHDGGYQAQPRNGEKLTAHHFFDVPDHLSRLAPDLRTRRWRVEINTPTVDPRKVNRHYPHFKWVKNHLGQTRVLRMRIDQRDNIYLAGWAPTQTSSEPWWSPFLFKYDGRGQRTWAAYNPDPMSGDRDRMNGLVSDAALRSVNLDHDANVLIATMGDGGNSVLKQDPRDYTRNVPGNILKGSVHSFAGRTLFWGTVGRVDAHSRELLGGNMLSGWQGTRRGRRLAAAWAIDIAPLPQRNAAVVGRHTQGFQFTRNAWDANGSVGFLRIYDPTFNVAFSTALDDVDPLMLEVRGQRIVIVGVSRSTKSPIHEPALRSSADDHDGYLMVVDIPGASSN